MTKTPYNTEFYDRNVKNSTPSALAVIGMLFEYYTPRSVVDFGCGSGAWLAGAEALGVTDLTGFDGPWVDPRDLTSANIHFRPLDFENQLPSLGRKYDLAISVEVAEHLSEALGNRFIELIASSADVIVFSAAIPYQGGTNHVNEQPQSYWIKLFADLNFRCYDIFRPAIWDNENVLWWFRQNIFLMVRQGSDVIDCTLLRKLETPIFDIVHPIHFLQKVRSCEQRIKKIKKENQRLLAKIEPRKELHEKILNLIRSDKNFSRVNRDVKRLKQRTLMACRRIRQRLISIFPNKD